MEVYVKRVLFLLFLVFAVPAWAQTTIDVKTAGLMGDGVTNDTPALQALVNSVQPNTTLYFPRGTYRIANLVVTGKTNLTFYGEGSTKSILQYIEPSPTSYQNMITFSNMNGLNLYRMGFDNRHILKYGGVVVYTSTIIDVANSRFYDSNPQPVGAYDCYGLVFGRGATPSSNITVRTSTFEYLQLEFDHVTNVRVTGNTTSYSRATAAIGFFTIGNSTVNQDIVVENNTIIDPQGTARAIAFNLDPANSSNVAFRRIQVLNNTVRRALYTTPAGGFSIFMGTPTIGTRSAGNIFEDITISGNLEEYPNPALAKPGFIGLMSRGDFCFRGVLVENNHADGEFQGRFIVQSIIQFNDLRRIAVVGAVLSTVTNNHAENPDAASYVFDTSFGNNQVITNTYTGPTAISTSGVASTDVIETPVLVP